IINSLGGLMLNLRKPKSNHDSSLELDPLSSASAFATNKLYNDLQLTLYPIRPYRSSCSYISLRFPNSEKAEDRSIFCQVSQRSLFRTVIRIRRMKYLNTKSDSLSNARRDARLKISIRSSLLRILFLSVKSFMI